ncbi:hypothetical protein GCM10028806_13040 [Spirosoma terrae]|uniref:Mechanosensitive ion channel n=1 Tax=Spirosoma terrae TaxID=1968276 RepID=A0A6L9L999_9BACT|nr:mechanosensitive ion channel domain-containing protein [Spirosoma terrae]NDU94958.1 mechanosensitive ion channel [Spirosoma terrae]
MLSIRSFFNLLILILLTTASWSLSAQDTARVTTTPSGQSIPDTLLFKIQKAQSIITEIKATEKKSYGITRIRSGLNSIKSKVAPVIADVQTHRKTTSAQNLSNYSLILNDALEKLAGWRTSLAKANNELQTQLNQVLALSNDTLLNVVSTDTTGKKLYAEQLVDLKFQLQNAGTRTSVRLDTVSRLLADVSGTFLTISNLQTTINEQVSQSKANVLRRESPYLWDAPATFKPDNVQTILQSSYQGQDKILKYFFSSTWDNRFLLIIMAGLFFFWVFSNFKKASQPPLKEKIGPLDFKHIRPMPIVASLIFLFNVAPLFEPQSPSVYIEITQFLLLVVLTVHLWKRFSKQELRLWLLNAVLYIVLIITNAVVGDSVFIRIWLIVLNVCFIYIGFSFAKQLHRKYTSDRIIRPVIRIYLILQLLAILLNVFGRISLAKTFGITATVGLVQITGLGLFIDIFLEALELQIKVSASSNGIFSRINSNQTRQSFKKGLVFIAIALWLLVFFINLGIADTIYSFIYQILTRPRSFGSITFTLSNILSFSAIVYLSSLLQKNIGLLFGESHLPTTTGNEVVKVSSVLALVRLAIIVLGVLLAVAASGISVDKFTVVLGALSVGIGLGMQNIVNNFISGIILLFEKPFRIGDYIELADRKGRIRDIGIRSSKMITGQGSEVIIPNADLLSNRLVNWSSSDTYLKTELLLKVGADTDLEALQDIIRQEVQEVDGTQQTMPPDIIINAIGADSVELKVVIWINSIYSEPTIKSQLFRKLLPRIKEASIRLV